MGTISISIDGYNVVVPSNVQLIDACRESGFWIPGLCHHQDLHPEGHCGLCVVEIDGFDKPQLSCMIKPESGMKIRTDSDEIRKLRIEALRTILADHPHGCLDCEFRFECDRTVCQYGKPEHDRCCFHFDDCELRMLTDWMGVPENTPSYKPKNHPRIIEQEIFMRNYDLCISCTRCARTCRTFEGLDIYRAYFRDGKLDASQIKPLSETDCSFCGFCVDSCPTGALSLLETDYGYLGYFPVGTPGRLRITPPPPSNKVRLSEIDINEIPENPGRLNIYDSKGNFSESLKCRNLRKTVSEYIHKHPDYSFTIQPDY